MMEIPTQYRSSTGTLRCQSHSSQDENCAKQIRPSASMGPQEECQFVSDVSVTLEAVPSAPTTIGTTTALTFHSFSVST